jgi:hypothetical protein
MYVARENIEDYVRNQSFLPRTHALISLTLNYLYVNDENIEYFLRNKWLSKEMHSEIEFMWK